MPTQGPDLLSLITQGGGTALALAIMGYMVKFFMDRTKELQAAMTTQVKECADAAAKQSADYIGRLESRDAHHAEERQHLTLALQELALRLPPARQEMSGPLALTLPSPR